MLNIVNKRFNKKIVMMVVVLLVVNMASASLFYELELFYENGEVEVKNKEVVFSNDDLTRYNIINDYYFDTHSVGLRDSRGDENRVEYGVLNKAYADNLKDGVDVGNYEEDLFDEGGLLEFESFTFILYLPYVEDGEELVFYDAENKEIGREGLDGFVGVEEKDGVDAKEDDEKEVNEFLDNDIGKKLSKYWILVLILVWEALMLRPNQVLVILYQ